jgi:hypothetical protein
MLASATSAIAVPIQLIQLRNSPGRGIRAAGG